MNRRKLFATLVVPAVSLLAAAAAKTYKYRCLKCQLIQEYGTMGTKKCPNDGSTMVRMD